MLTIEDVKELSFSESAALVYFSHEHKLPKKIVITDPFWKGKDRYFQEATNEADCATFSELIVAEHYGLSKTFEQGERLEILDDFRAALREISPDEVPDFLREIARKEVSSNE